MNHKIVTSLLKNTLSVAYWFLPSAIYFKFAGINSQEIVDEFKIKCAVGAPAINDKLCSFVNNEAGKIGQLSELYRGYATFLVPAVAYLYSVAQPFFSQHQQKGEDYVKLAFFTYVASTSLAAILKAGFKRVCLDELREELYRAPANYSAHLAQQQYKDGLESRIKSKFNFPSTNEEWEKLEKEVNNYDV